MWSIDSRFHIRITCTPSYFCSKLESNLEFRAVPKNEFKEVIIPFEILTSSKLLNLHINAYVCIFDHND